MLRTGRGAAAWDSFWECLWNILYASISPRLTGGLLVPSNSPPCSFLINVDAVPVGWELALGWWLLLIYLSSRHPFALSQGNVGSQFWPGKEPCCRCHEAECANPNELANLDQPLTMKCGTDCCSLSQREETTSPSPSVEFCGLNWLPFWSEWATQLLFNPR